MRTFTAEQFVSTISALIDEPIQPAGFTDQYRHVRSAVFFELNLALDTYRGILANANLPTVGSGDVLISLSASPSPNAAWAAYQWAPLGAIDSIRSVWLNGVELLPESGPTEYADETSYRIATASADGEMAIVLGAPVANGVLKVHAVGTSAWRELGWRSGGTLVQGDTDTIAMVEGGFQFVTAETARRLLIKDNIPDPQRFNAVVAEVQSSKLNLLKALSRLRRDPVVVKDVTSCLFRP